MAPQAKTTNGKPSKRAAKPKRTPFRFFALPAELRIRIYEIVYYNHRTIDLGSLYNARITRVLEQMFVNHQFHNEAKNVFFGINTFRIFSTDNPRTRKPLIPRMPASAREALHTLELKLGPDWRRPPATWDVTPAYKLSECKNLRLLKVFVELDPDDSPICREWMLSRVSYTIFSGTLLTKILEHTPVQVVQFDGFPSVPQNGPLLTKLRALCAERGVRWIYGPIRAWMYEGEGLDDSEKEKEERMRLLAKSMRHLSMGLPAF